MTNGKTRPPAVAPQAAPAPQPSGCTAVPTSVQPDAVVASALRTLTHRQVHGFTLQQDLPPLPAVACDEERLAQVVMSLVVHAGELIPEALPVQARRVRVRCWANAEEVCVCVEHDGPGHDRAQPSSDGASAAPRASGLGLPNSHTLVQEMGGWLQVERTPSQGASFTMHLPVRRARSRAPLQPVVPRASRLAPKQGTLRLLVVDDERPVVQALERSLRPLGQVEGLGSGTQAMARLSLDSHFDVVLCDMVMPDGSGPDLASWIQRYRPQLYSRLIFMTGMAGFVERLSGEVPTVQKPFDINALRDVLLSVAATAAAESASVPPPRRGRR